MPKRRKKFILLACGMLALALVWQFLRDREPEYQDRTLSEWVAKTDWDAWSANSDEERAIRRIGTNAIPHILDWISYEASPLRKKIATLAQRLPPDFSPGFLSYPEQRADRAEIVFSILGPQAHAAIPELTRLVLTSSDCHRSGRCINSLSYRALYLPLARHCSRDAYQHISAISRRLRTVYPRICAACKCSLNAEDAKHNAEERRRLSLRFSAKTSAPLAKK